jgi:ribonuclease HI
LNHRIQNGCCFCGDIPNTSPKNIPKYPTFLLLLPFIAAFETIIMAKKQKYYTVWVGAKTGVFDTWEKCSAQIQGFPQAKYKSFETKAEAEYAFAQKPEKFIFAQKKTETETKATPTNAAIDWDNSICVDAACSGNPGKMEYRGVLTRSKTQIFHVGPLDEGTNNIGEFLALVHALALLQREDKPTMTIYTDSKTAMAWVRNKKAKTELKETPRNQKIFDLIDRATDWLNNHTYTNKIVKWETEKWGEIPADFGRK